MAQVSFFRWAWLTRSHHKELIFAITALLLVGIIVSTVGAITLTNLGLPVLLIACVLAIYWVCVISLILVVGVFLDMVPLYNQYKMICEEPEYADKSPDEIEAKAEQLVFEIADYQN